MKFIIVREKTGQTRTLSLSSRTLCLAVVLSLSAVAGVGVWKPEVFKQDRSDDLLSEDLARAWAERVDEQRQELQSVKQRAEEQVDALALRTAALQARLTRLDALGERLTTMAKLDEGEFDFSEAPALGGPESSLPGEMVAGPDFLQVIDQLAEQVADRETQLDALEALLAKRKIQDELFVAGRPIKKGWMSSRFGRRTDPFNGNIAWHNGVDFAGKMGSDIVAVASGVVTWSGKRSGYGQMVEVNHGQGFSTRYAHNSKNLVAVGDVIKKGQVIALMGSSGRSTGPHVHFEVYKHGRAVDPSTYIHRASR